MNTKYKSPPRTAMEVFEMLPEGTLAEVINNVIYMSPSPSFHHQDSSFDLAFAIRSFVASNQLGKCLVAPLDIFFDDKNVLQPDILFISKENMGIVQNDKVKGAPDFIIEILSEGNRMLDLETKKSVYERFGVKEYFVVDPKTKEVTTFYFTGKKYEKQLSTRGKITSKLLNQSFSF